MYPHPDVPDMRGQSKAVVRTLNVAVRSVSIAAQPEAARSMLSGRPGLSVEAPIF